MHVFKQRVSEEVQRRMSEEVLLANCFRVFFSVSSSAAYELSNASFFVSCQPRGEKNKLFSNSSCLTRTFSLFRGNNLWKDIHTHNTISNRAWGGDYPNKSGRNKASHGLFRITKEPPHRHYKITLIYIHTIEF